MSDQASSPAAGPSWLDKVIGRTWLEKCICLSLLQFIPFILVIMSIQAGNLRIEWRAYPFRAKGDHRIVIVDLDSGKVRPVVLPPQGVEQLNQVIDRTRHPQGWAEPEEGEFQ